jgi:hypothetical protein
MADEPKPKVMTVTGEQMIERMTKMSPGAFVTFSRSVIKLASPVIEAMPEDNEDRAFLTALLLACIEHNFRLGALVTLQTHMAEVVDQVVAETISAATPDEEKH